jgi:alpha-beta hydrolase superfamily lysophospholipase
MKKTFLKKTFLLLGLLLGLKVFTATAQVDYQQSAGRFQQAADRFRDFYNRQLSDSIFALFSPQIKELSPPDKTKQMVTQLQGQYGFLKSADLIKQETGYATYKGIFAKGMLTIILALDKDGYLDGLRFAPYNPEAAKPERSNPEVSNPAAAGPGVSNFTLKTVSGNIYGTLVLPKGDQKVPVVLIIAGSGPTDRNGNASSMGLNTNAYKMLADSFLQHGIASLRYDKRGIGESAAAMKSESDLKFEDYISDAAGLIKMLRADGRFSKVIVLGHSEGSLIGMIAAGREKADAYISLAGVGERIDKPIERQLEAQSPALAAKATILFDSLSKGYTVQQPDVTLMSLFRPSVQPYMISWLQYDPQQEIRKLKMPVLLIQGTTDFQVSVQDAQLLAKAKPDATLELIEGMNHILKQGPAGRAENMATYNMPELPLKAELVQDIETFILHRS